MNKIKVFLNLWQYCSPLHQVYLFFNSGSCSLGLSVIITRSCVRATLAHGNAGVCVILCGFLVQVKNRSNVYQSMITILMLHKYRSNIISWYGLGLYLVGNVVYRYQMASHSLHSNNAVQISSSVVGTCWACAIHIYWVQVSLILFLF